MAADLAKRHELVGNLFSLPKNPAEWDRYRLSEDHLRHYRKKGFVSGVRILNDEQVDALRDEVAAIMQPSHPGHHLFYEFHSNESSDPNTVLFHALGAWRITPGLHDLLWAAPFVTAASQLLEGAVRFWHDQLFCKPAKHGGVVAWHQDYSYWTRTKPMAHLTCWIGLDDSTQENGCMQYIPGSHRWDLLPITGLAGDMEAIREVLTPDQWEAMQHPHPVELKKGECSFHHPLLIHGSYANYTDRPRRAVVLNVFRDGVCSDSNDELLAGVPPVPKGKKMEGDFFPLLYQPN